MRVIGDAVGVDAHAHIGLGGQDGFDGVSRRHDRVSFL